MNRAPIKYMIDLTVWLFSTPLAFLIRLESRWLEYGAEIGFLILAGLPLKILAIHVLGLHRRSWHNVGIRDLFALVAGCGVVSGLLLAVVLIGVEDLSIPRSVPVIEGMLALFLMSLARLDARIVSERLTSPGKRKAARHILIVGAGEAGTMIAREMLRHRASGRIPVGFLDDDSIKRRQLYTGLCVLGKIDELPLVVAKHSVDEILIAMPSVGGSVIRRVVDLARKAGVEYRTIPGIYELFSGKVSISRIREVNVEDLLRRDAIRLSPDNIAQYLTGKVVMITGAGGSVGSEISRQVASFRPRILVLLGRGENSIFQIERELARIHPEVELAPVITDIRDELSLVKVFEQFRPKAVFHAAAHKHVPLMELNPAQAVLNNVGGTHTLVNAALRFGVERFVNVSTDKAVNPTSVMGATKRVAEIIVFRASQRCDGNQTFMSVRFGNVLGSRGSVLPIFQEQIRCGGPVTITHREMERYFMTIPEASQLVLEAGSMADNGAVYVLDMGEPVRIVDLAYDLIRLSGFEPESDISIAVSGIRPGEKLFEELLTAEEGIIASHHEKIFVARGNGLREEADFDSLLEQLILSASAHELESVRALLCRMIPTHRLAMPLEEDRDSFLQMPVEVPMNQVN